MNDKIPTATSRIHPLVAGAAISVTLLSVVGTAAIAGWLPTSNANAPAASQLSAPVPATAAVAQDPAQYPAQYAPAPGQQQFASTQGQPQGQYAGQAQGQNQGQYAGQAQGRAEVNWRGTCLGPRGVVGG